MTPAVRALRAAGVPFTAHFYRYVERGGTCHAAEALQVPEHEVVKTLVMESEDASGRKTPCLVLMHGDREVSTRQLARFLGVKQVAPTSEKTVEHYTGYVPGGVSPLGTRLHLPVYVESTILALPRLVVNGGKRGFLVEITPADLRTLLPLTEVSVAVAPEPPTSPSSPHPHRGPGP